MSIQALREQIAALAKATKELVEGRKGKPWTAENQETYDQNMAQIDDLKAQKSRLESVLALTEEDVLNAQISDAHARHVHGKDSSAVALFNKWLAGGNKAITAEEWRTIRATMSTTTPGEGGYTVPTEVASRIIEALKAYGGMRKVATVVQTDGGNDWGFPTSDGASEVGEIVGQNVTAATADPSFGTVPLVVYKFSSKTVAIPFELLQDSAVDIEAFVRQRLAVRVHRITNQKFTVGSGTNEPKGVVAAAGAGKVGATGQTATVTYDDLIDLLHSVDPAYRELGNCRWMMNDATLKVIRKIKDTEGRPIFVPGYDGLGGAMPDTILGYPVQINQDVAVMAANAKSILFGDFSFYTIRDVRAAQLFRFEDSAFITKGQVGFLQWSRHGGALLDVAAVKYYQNAAS